MRRTSKLLLMVLLLFAFFSCKDDDADNDYLELSTSVLRFTDQSERQSLLVKSSSVAPEEVNVNCPAEWVFIEPFTERGQYTVTVLENPDPSVRTTVITLTAGNCIQEIDVLQAARESSLELTTGHIQCWDLNYKVTMGIRTKEAWTATPRGDWFQLEKTAGKGDDCIRIIFQQNSLPADRNGEVVVRAESGVERVFSFTQTAALPNLGAKGDSLACAAIYKHFNGAENWKDCNWCQPGVPFKMWSGVHINAYGRVERIFLTEKYKCEATSFPEEIKNLTSLLEFSCFYTGYQGELPYELLRCPLLQRINFNGCPVTGKLEPWMGSFWYLSDFNIRSGKLTGTLPYEMGGLENLVYLRLNNNQLTGEIPPCWNLKRMSEFMLPKNKLSGNIPANFGEMLNLTILDVAGNSDMQGEIPEEVCALKVSGSLVDFFTNDTALKGCD